MSDATRSSMLESALGYAAEGLRVFRLAPRDKVPLIPAAEGGHGCHDGTTDEEQIRAWWDGHHDRERPPRG
jgi:hypothetical protein